MLIVVTALAVAAAAAAPPPHSAPAQAKLHRSEARAVVQIVAGGIAQPFTEHDPRIRPGCTLTSRTRAVCHVHVTGDRLDATLTLRIRKHADGNFIAFASRLTTR